MQPAELIFDVQPKEHLTVYARIDYHSCDESHRLLSSRFESVDWKHIVSKVNPVKIGLMLPELYDAGDGRTKSHFVEYSLRIDKSDTNAYQLKVVEKETKEDKVARLKRFMWLNLYIDTEPCGIFESFNASLTSVGSEQCDFLEKELLKISEVFISSGLVHMFIHG